MKIDSYVAKRIVKKTAEIATDQWLARTQDVDAVLRQAAVLPQAVDFETTNVCNANCVFCAYQFQERPTGVMEMDLYRRLIQEVAELGITTIGFTPLVGDPLVDPHILERAALARELGIESIGFFTNGILFKKVGIEAILTSGLTHLRLSTAGFDEESYRRIYRSTRYRQMYGGLVELLERNQALGHPVEVTLCIRADETLSEIRKKEDFRRIEPLIDGVEANLRFDSWSGRITAKALPAGMQLRPVPKKNFPCSLLYWSLTVLWNGEVTACGCRDLDGNGDLVLGNAHERSLVELWSGAKLAALRSNWMEAQEVPNICKDCSHYTPATKLLRGALKQRIELSAGNAAPGTIAAAPAGMSGAAD